MPHLSDRIANLHESATIKMAQMGRELKAQGKDIISLSLGEPDFVTPKHICEAAKTAIDQGFTFYTAVPGTIELRKAIADKFKRDNGLEYSPEQIVVSTGAKQSLINVVLCLVNPGEEVIVPAPFWVSYAAMVELAEGKMVNIFTGIEQDFKITPEQLEAAITPKTRMMIFSSPSNPSGSVYSKEELQGLAKVLAKYPEIYIVSDEIYEYINYDGKHESIAQFPEVFNQTITVNGFAKGFAMTGWRVGYIGAPLWIAKACDKLQGQFTSATCSIAQKAAEAALTSDMSPTWEMRDQFHRRRDMMIAQLSQIPGLKVNTPSGAFYLFPDVSAYFGKTYNGETIKDADDLALYLLAEAHVALVSGSAFGSPECIRISYAASDKQLTEACIRLKAALAKLS
ncbi:pyridoxal phosphate-dependent aminotransferase [soil metagenome]